MRRYETALENIQNKQNKNLRKNNPYSSFNNTLCIPQKKNCADINYKYDEMKNYVKTHANYFQLHIRVDFPHTQLLLVVAGFNPNIFTDYA